MPGTHFECRECLRQVGFGTGSAVPARSMRPRKYLTGWVCTTCAQKILDEKARRSKRLADKKAINARKPGPGQANFFEEVS